MSYEDLHVLEDKKNPCEECQLFDQHGKNCWFYWENKRDCSQRSD